MLKLKILLLHSRFSKQDNIPWVRNSIPNHSRREEYVMAIFCLWDISTITHGLSASYFYHQAVNLFLWDTMSHTGATPVSLQQYV
jgi:hypothetical protein